MSVLSPVSGSLAWGSFTGKMNPEHLALKTSGLNFGSHNRLWETEISLLKGAYTISHAPGHKAKLLSDGSLGHTYLLVMEGPPERREATAHPGDTNISSMFSDLNTVRLEINSKTKKKTNKTNQSYT